MNSTVPSSPKDNAHDVIRCLLETIEMQNKRERGEYHISNVTMRMLRERAVMRAERFLRA